MEISRFFDSILSISGSYDKVIAYRHEIPGNNHYHGLLENYRDTPEWFRKKIKKLFNLESKAQYSCKYKDISCNFISYMSKGKLDPVINIGYDPILVSELKALGYDAKETLKTEKTKWDYYEMMRGRIHTMGLYPIHDYEKVVEVIRKVLMDNKQVIGFYKIKDYYDMLMLSESPGTIAEKIRKYYLE